jgi:selenophosphate synthase
MTKTQLLELIMKKFHKEKEEGNIAYTANAVSDIFHLLEMIISDINKMGVPNPHDCEG